MMKKPLLLFAGLIVCLGAVGVSQESVESRTGRFSATIERTGSAKIWPESNIWQATVKDASGKVLYEVQKNVPYDFQFPAIYLSDFDGSAVIIASAEGIVEWYSPGGSVVAALYPFGNEAPDYERIIKCSIGADRVALLISSPEMENPVLHLTNMRGEKIWQVSLNHRHAGEVFLSPGGKFVLAGSYDVNSGVQKGSYLVNSDVEIVRSFPMMFRTADMDESDGIIVMADRNNVMITGMEEGVLFEYATGGKSSVITGVQLVGQNTLVTVESIQANESGIKYVDPSLLLLDSQAAVIGEKKFIRVSTTPLKVQVRGVELIIDGAAETLKLSDLIH